MAAEDSTDSPASNVHSRRIRSGMPEREKPVNCGLPRNCGHESAGAA
jgi:hypothetical protein